MSINTPREIIQSQIATHNVASPVGSEVMSNMQGRSRATSEGVTVSTNNADITDALEELGMAKATRGKGDLDKMKVRKGAGTDLEALGRIAEYYDKLPNLPSDQKSRDLVLKMQTFEDMFKGGGTGGGDMPTAEDLRELLRQYDGDISHQFAALEDARARFGAAGASPEFLALLDGVRAEMRDPETAQDIRAGFASAREAHTAADRFASSPEAYRDSYRQMIRAGGHLGRIFDALGDFAQGNRTGSNVPSSSIDEVLSSFLNVAGADMQSFGPSTDPAILGDVISELTVLKNVRTVLDMGTNLSATISRMFGDDAPALPSNVQIASSLFHFASSPVASLSEAEQMLARFDASNPEVPVIAVNMLRDMHASLPDSALPSDTARLQQSSVLLTLSDKLVATEEASYGA